MSHDEMVKIVVDKCINTGYTDVKANLPEMDKPEMIYDIIPDVTGKINVWVFVFEIETEESIDSYQTELRWKAFAKFAKFEIQNFFIVIPRGLYRKVEAKIEGLRISASIIEL